MFTVWAHRAGARMDKKGDCLSSTGWVLPVYLVVLGFSWDGYISSGHWPEKKRFTHFGPCHRSIPMHLCDNFLISLFSTSNVFQGKSFVIAQVTLCIFLPVTTFPMKLMNSYTEKICQLGKNGHHHYASWILLIWVVCRNCLFSAHNNIWSWLIYELVSRYPSNVSWS